MCALNFVPVTSLAIVLKLKCVCVLCVSYLKCADNTFFYGRVHCPVKQQKRGGSVTVPPEFLECYFMYVILGNVSILKSLPLQVAGSFTLNCWLWNVTIKIADSKQQPIFLSDSLQAVSYLNILYCFIVGVLFCNWIFQGIVFGNKRSWRCIGLNYNA
jgi:hypothetical protein